MSPYMDYKKWNRKLVYKLINVGCVVVTIIISFFFALFFFFFFYLFQFVHWCVCIINLFIYYKQIIKKKMFHTTLLTFSMEFHILKTLRKKKHNNHHYYLASGCGYNLTQSKVYNKSHLNTCYVNIFLIFIFFCVIDWMIKSPIFKRVLYIPSSCFLCSKFNLLVSLHCVYLYVSLKMVW